MARRIYNQQRQVMASSLGHIKSVDDENAMRNYDQKTKETTLKGTKMNALNNQVGMGIQGIGGLTTMGRQTYKKMKKAFDAVKQRKADFMEKVERTKKIREYMGDDKKPDVGNDEFFGEGKLSFGEEGKIGYEGESKTDTGEDAWTWGGEAEETPRADVVSSDVFGDIPSYGEKAQTTADLFREKPTQQPKQFEFEYSQEEAPTGTPQRGLSVEGRIAKGRFQQEQKPLLDTLDRQSYENQRGADLSDWEKGGSGKSFKDFHNDRMVERETSPDVEPEQQSSMFRTSTQTAKSRPMEMEMTTMDKRGVLKQPARQAEPSSIDESLTSIEDVEPSLGRGASVLNQQGKFVGTLQEGKQLPADFSSRGIGGAEAVGEGAEEATAGLTEGAEGILGSLEAVDVGMNVADIIPGLGEAVGAVSMLGGIGLTIASSIIGGQQQAEQQADNTAQYNRALNTQPNYAGRYVANTFNSQEAFE